MKEINKLFFFNVLLIIIIFTLTSITVFSIMNENVSTMNQTANQTVNINQKDILKQLNVINQKSKEVIYCNS